MSVYKNRSAGLTLVEILVGVALVSGAILALLTIVSRSVLVSRDTLRRAQATFLAEEGVEAMRVMRDRGWSDLAAIPGLYGNPPYYIFFNGLTWKPTSTPEVIDGIFTRSFLLSAVKRDANDDIAPTGTLDPKTLKVHVDVAWLSTIGRYSTTSVETYITNLFNG